MEHTGIITTLLKVARNAFVEIKKEQLRINIKKVPARLVGIFFGLPRTVFLPFSRLIGVIRNLRRRGFKSLKENNFLIEY